MQTERTTELTDDETAGGAFDPREATDRGSRTATGGVDPLAGAATARREEAGRRRGPA